MSNLFKAFERLVSRPSLQLGTVVAVDATGGFVTLELPGGAQLQVRGEAAIDDDVYFRDGVVESTAPSLPIDLIDV